MSKTGVEIGVDIGGTFTDIVCTMSDGEIRLLKVPSTRGDQSDAVASAIARLKSDLDIDPKDVTRFAHGTTVATNAVLERRGAKIGLLTTEGFKDLLEIGRQNRRSLYDLKLQPAGPSFLVPGALRKGVVERIGADGEVVTPLDETSLRRAVRELLDEGVQVIAVSFLFAFLNPVHERRARAVIAEMAPEMDVSLGSEVDPAFREYERTCATAFDAYVKPVMRRYLANMEKRLEAGGVTAPFQVMQSRGGLSLAKSAVERPIRLFLSGPAAGVIGGRAVGDAVGIKDLITVDIGGTSCDIALIDRGNAIIRSEGEIDGYTVRVPMVDVNAIGAGGGSIAWIDAAGGLRIGPQSAGSDPGPACYGRGGTQATVTDASIVLGYLNPDNFAGGTLRLDAALAHRAIDEGVAKPMGLSVQEAALGIHRVINATMAEGIRLVSVKRGIDPRNFALVPLGGGGAVHATALADELAIRRVVVPRFPGVLSAFGLLAAPIEHEVSAGLQRVLGEVLPSLVQTELNALDARCAVLMASERSSAETRILHFADVCYVGQSYYLEIPIVDHGPSMLDRLYRDFLAAHDRIYGHAVEAPVRLANLRSIHRSVVASDADRRAYAPSGSAMRKADRPIYVSGRATPVIAEVWDRNALPVGHCVVGPAIVEQADTTLVVSPGWTAKVAVSGELILTASEESRA